MRFEACPTYFMRPNQEIGHLSALTVTDLFSGEKYISPPQKFIPTKLARHCWLPPIAEKLGFPATALPYSHPHSVMLKMSRVGQAKLKLLKYR